MPSGLFVDFSEAEVLAIRSQAKTMLTEGKTILSWSSGNTSTSKSFVMPVREVLEECRYALRKINPTDYGALVTRARCNFDNYIPER
jgi:hypothetical protein